MEDKNKKSGRGGARKGAGRPKGDSKMITFRAPGYMAKHIESQKNKTDYIRQCIEKDINKDSDLSFDINTVIENTIDNVLVDDVIISDASDTNVSDTSISLDFPDLSGIGELINAASMDSVYVPSREDFKDVKNDASPLEKVDLLKILCPNKDTSFIIIMKGDSMKDANIFDGDTIIIDSGKRNPTDNQLALCELNGEFTIKYVRVHDGKGYLLPANPNYPEWRITNDDRFCIWGIVTYLIHAPRNI